MQLNGTEYVPVAATARGGALHPSLPTRPQFDIAEKKLTKSEKEAASIKAGLANLEGSNEDIALNRKAIRMANLDAAARLKAELMGEPIPDEPVVELKQEEDDEKVEMPAEEARGVLAAQAEAEGGDEELVPPALEMDVDETPLESEAPSRMSPALPGAGRGTKRTIMEADLEDPPNPDADQPVSKKKLKFNSDGTVDGYVDDVR
jgi:5'-3' exoribonuclease 2